MQFLSKMEYLELASDLAIRENDVRKQEVQTATSRHANEELIYGIHCQIRRLNFAP